MGTGVGRVDKREYIRMKCMIKGWWKQWRERERHLPKARTDFVKKRRINNNNNDNNEAHKRKQGER